MKKILTQIGVTLLGIAFVFGFPALCVKIGLGSEVIIDGVPITKSKVLEFTAMSAPSVSSAGKAKIYFSSADNKLKLSQNGGAYADIGAGAGTGDMANAVEGVAIAADTTTLGGSITTLSASTTTLANSITTLSASTTTLNNVKASTTTPTFTGTSTFNGDINSTGTITANKLVLTGTGPASLPQGLVGNEDGGSTADSDIRFESDTEEYMYWVDSSENKTYMGGSTNGVTIDKGGKVTSIGTAVGLAWSGSPCDKGFTITSPSNTFLVSGSSIPLGAEIRFAITVDSISVTCDADPTTEISGDLKYADAAIGWANATIINSITTTAGVLKDASMTSGNVAANKQLYINLHAQPDAATKFLAITLYGHYQ